MCCLGKKRTLEENIHTYMEKKKQIIRIGKTPRI